MKVMDRIFLIFPAIPVYLLTPVNFLCGQLKMELEFDKEIDAILRKARDSGTAAIAAIGSPHADADAVAAFAENVLPDKAKRLYMEHFADCDTCRRMLSQTILLNSEAEAATASSVVSGPIVGTVIPWYQRLFGTPNFALLMGALVLSFSGILGYLMMQNSGNSSEADVAKVTESQPTPGGPSYNPDIIATNSNAPPSEKQSNMAATANVPMSGPNSNAMMPAANSMANSAGRADVTDSPSTGTLDKSPATDSVASEAAKPLPAAPLQPPAAAPLAHRDEKKGEPEKQKEESKDLTLGGRKMDDDRLAREKTANKRNTGPSRASGNAQQQLSTQDSSVFNISSTRQVGGKSFDFRNGVWYDRAYHSQKTRNFRRSTDDYKKLDGGLRNIAASLGGTVVVVWKEKAYRIQ